MVTAHHYLDVPATGLATGRLTEHLFFSSSIDYDVWVLDPIANPSAESLTYSHDHLGREVGVVHESPLTPKPLTPARVRLQFPIISPVEEGPGP